ncbi:N-acetylmuramoyl-L-alanine amidase [Mastigocoleus sp. MO_188.B34]|uniref:N-acetylmuramoyl-L-alanine amidase n=1 Tax=Mastigocoleus sp. MO_188.B34 TaxID=3036635 RepID=UPI0026348360|nr:N-acetylmuramoyl-L-alanine amidase [Mastigocoleus sp. MO_188.B34]MDJ0694552.1 N-acetylmuramoyl-L-alanine amidase [Mastigocoleus sp. MO_188.B34]
MMFAIDIGHNCPPDTGAVSANYSEDILTKEVGNRVIKLLQQRGHRAIAVNPKRCSSVINSLRQRVNKANVSGADIFVSIHFNKFSSPKAKGSEVFAFKPEGKGRALAQSVLNQILKLGFTNRGVKYSGFYVIKNTFMPAILIECCFISSSEDMQKFNADKMALAIVNGLVGEDVREDITGKLRINVSTYAKPNSEQSEDLEPELLYLLEPGDYAAKLIGDEESHFVVEFVDRQLGDRDTHYVYSGHCEFLEA